MAHLATPAHNPDIGSPPSLQMYPSWRGKFLCLIANPAALNSICLLQIGPRLELEVVKVEEGLCDGKVLYHGFVKKSAGEASHQQSEKEKERELKEKRRKQQVW